MTLVYSPTDLQAQVRDELRKHTGVGQFEFVTDQQIHDIVAAVFNEDLSLGDLVHRARLRLVFQVCCSKEFMKLVEAA